MKLIKLTQGKFAIVDDEDFDYLNQFKWCFDKTNGYAHRGKWVNGKNKKEYMHRIIINISSDKEVDHANRNKLDNRKVNLRSVTRFQNSLNKGLQKNNTTGFKGITLLKDKYWIAQLKYNGVSHYLGCFSDVNQALEARKKAEEKYHNL